MPPQLLHASPRPLWVHDSDMDGCVIPRRGSPIQSLDARPSHLIFNSVTGCRSRLNFRPRAGVIPIHWRRVVRPNNRAAPQFGLPLHHGALPRLDLAQRRRTR